MTEPRGIRNCNPGNIRRRKGVVWEGQSAVQGGPFVRFTEPKWGIRAICRVLITYADARKARDGSRIDTVADVIGRWAPPSENDTGAYAAHVRARLGVAPGEILSIKDPATMQALVEAIVLHENGVQPYTEAQIHAGMALAGIEPARKPLHRSRTVRGGQLAAATGAAATVAGAMEQIAPALPVLGFIRENLGFALLLAGAAVLIGVGVMIYARWDDRRKGLR